MKRSFLPIAALLLAMSITACAKPASTAPVQAPPAIPETAQSEEQIDAPEEAKSESPIVPEVESPEENQPVPADAELMLPDIQMDLVCADGAFDEIVSFAIQTPVFHSFENQDVLERLNAHYENMEQAMTDYFYETVFYPAQERHTSANVDMSLSMEPSAPGTLQVVTEISVQYADQDEARLETHYELFDLDSGELMESK